MGVLICPICKSRLEQEERRFACKNGHSFDLAAAGYLHLLPSNRIAPKFRGQQADGAGPPGLFEQRLLPAGQRLFK